MTIRVGFFWGGWGVDWVLLEKQNIGEKIKKNLNIMANALDRCVGGAVASWLLHSTPEQAIWV